MKNTPLIIIAIILLFFFFSPFSAVAIQGDSMDPTIPNQALLLTYETNDVAENDIVTFYSEQTNGYVTHRIIETTENGNYITLGDNNNVPDQEIGIAPLQPQNVDSKALVVNGQPLFIPYLGGLIILLQQNLIAVAAIGLSAISGLYFIRNRVQNQRLYSNIVAKDVFQPIIIVTLLLVVIVFIFNATVLTIPFAYTDSGTASQQQYVVPTSSSEQIEEIRINSTSQWYTHKIYVFNGFNAIEINENKTKQQTRITAQLPPREDVGAYETSVSIYTIPAVMPQSIAQQLAQTSPIIPIAISTLITLTPFYLIYRFYVGPKTPIRSPRINDLISNK